MELLAYIVAESLLAAVLIVIGLEFVSFIARRAAKAAVDRLGKKYAFE